MFGDFHDLQGKYSIPNILDDACKGKQLLKEILNRYILLSEGLKFLYIRAQKMIRFE